MGLAHNLAWAGVKQYRIMDIAATLIPSLIAQRTPVPPGLVPDRKCQAVF